MIGLGDRLDVHVLTLFELLSDVQIVVHYAGNIISYNDYYFGCDQLNQINGWG